MAPRDSSDRFLKTVILGTAALAFGMIVWGWVHLITQEDPFWEIGWIGDGIVVSQEPSGPFYDAGIRKYDQILTLNGRPPDPMPAMHPGLAPGDTVSVRYLPAPAGPGVAPVATEVVLAGMPLHRQFAQGIKLLLAMIALLLGALVGAWRPGKPLALVVCALMLMAAFTYTSNVLRLSTPNGMRIARILELWSSGLLLHACLSFAHASSSRLYVWSVRALYGLLGLLSLLIATVPLLLESAQNETSLWLLGNRIVFGAMATFMTTALLVLFFSKASTALRERRRRIVVGGITLALFPMLAFSVLPETVGDGPILPYAYANAFLVLIPIAFSYALYHGMQARLDRAVHNTSVYVLFVVLTMAAATPLFYAVYPYLPASPWPFALIGGALIVLIGTSFGRARLLLEHGLDQLIYGGWHRYREIVRYVSAELDHADDTRRPVNLMLDMARTMRLRPVILYTHDGDRLVPDPLARTVYSIDGTPSLPLYGQLSQYFLENAYPTWHHRLRDVVPEDELLDSERRLLEQSRFHLKHSLKRLHRGRDGSEAENALLWVPLVSRGSLIGLLALQSRDHHLALFSEDDLDMLAALAGQVALSMENAELNATLSSRLREVEAIRDDLAEAQLRLTHERENERSRLARELHDGPLQMMFGIRYQLDELEEELTEALDDSNGLRERCDRARDSLQEVAKTLRITCYELRPPAPMPLRDSLLTLADKTRSLYPDVDVRMRVMPEDVPLPDIARLTLYRICQEAMNNALRHGQARTITVYFEHDVEQVLLEVQDDGRGFEVPQRWTSLAREGHLGIIGMSERAGSIGGTFSIESRPGHGTRVRVSIPSDRL